MDDEELRKKIDDVLDTMAEVYCQLGENPAMSARRTRPLQAGAAYGDEIMHLIKQDRGARTVAGEAKDGDNLSPPLGSAPRQWR
jgi:hypothetical protein